MILLIGMNHTTAPVEVRECLATNPNSHLLIIEHLKLGGSCEEVIFFSTCNRVEVLGITKSEESALEEILGLFAQLSQRSKEEFLPYLYIKRDREAVRHLFRVASSLDSMVVGEPQILGQIKESYRFSADRKGTGVILNRLMHRAFHTAKRVRTETGICDSAVSISYAAVELAKKIFHDLKGKSALLIGAGEMAELAARHLIKNGIKDMMVANRSLDKAVELSREFGGTAHSLEELRALLGYSDIVIVSTGAKEYIIDQATVKAAVKKRRDVPLFLIDISVPRNVEPAVGKLTNVYLYDIDDLKEVVGQNMAQRVEEAKKAERIVEEEVIKFERWLETLEVVPTIVALHKKAEEIIQGELKRSRALLSRLDEEQKDLLNILLRSVADKILNDPILFLKERANRKGLQNYLDMTQRLFNLNGFDHNKEEGKE